MDKKLTDSEITINALKKLLEVMLSEGDLQRTSTISHTIDLINRLQAENDNYSHNNRTMTKDILDLQKENEELRVTIKAFTDFGKLYSEIKSEAYKEFANNTVERVEKAKLKYQRLCEEQGEKMEEHMHIHFNGIIKIINNLLKELVGNSNVRS